MKDVWIIFKDKRSITYLNTSLCIQDLVKDSESRQPRENIRNIIVLDKL